MAISNEDIYKKLDDIHKLIITLKKEEEQVIQEEHKIEMEEEKLIDILGKEVNRQFDNIMDWKNYIWEACEYKKSVVKADKIDFICKKTGKTCRFIDCFKNKVE